MYKVIDIENNFKPVKSGFKTAAQANNWCKKNLPLDKTHLWGCKPPPYPYRYFVMG